MFPIRVTLKKADVDLPGLAGTRQITVKNLSRTGRSDLTMVELLARVYNIDHV